MFDEFGLLLLLIGCIKEFIWWSWLLMVWWAAD